MKPEDFNPENIIPEMPSTNIEFSTLGEQTAIELTTIRKLITSYINTVLDEEQKKKFMTHFNSPNT